MQCRVGILILACLLLSGAILGFGDSSGWAQAPEPVPSMSKPQVLPPLPPGTGFVPPPIDLLHLPMTFPAARAKAMIQQPTAQWDWRWSGDVTSVKNQGACGACFAFASIANFESKILVDGGSSLDLSENNAKECPYVDPPCSTGGTYYQTAELFSHKGTVLETDDPYVASDTSCNSTVSYRQTMLDWCIISGGAVPTTSALKSYIHSNGPVYTTFYVGTGSGDPWYDELGIYDGSYGLYHPSTGATPNHAVMIVGWDDNKVIRQGGPGGTIMGTGCWIVKNSWSSGWGDSGYFHIAYQHAEIGKWSSFLNQWQTYDTNGGLLYIDEEGWNTQSCGWDWSQNWGLARLDASGITSTKAWAIEFYTNDVTTDVDVYLYDSFNTASGGTLGTLLAQSLNNSFSEAGYHQVRLPTPYPDIGTTPGRSNPAAVVRITNQTYGSPTSTVCGGPLASGRSYISVNGTNGSWVETSTWTPYNSDVCVRIRTSTSPPAVSDAELY
jgi:C1A family cysteine protease